MSTRYVWGRYDYALDLERTINAPSSLGEMTVEAMDVYLSSQIAVGTGNTVELLNPSVDSHPWGIRNVQVSAGQYFYVEVHDGYRTRIPSSGIYYAANGCTLNFDDRGTKWYLRLTRGQLQLYIYYTRGTKVGTISNASSSTYPPRDNCVLSYRYWPLRSPRSSPR